MDDREIALQSLELIRKDMGPLAGSSHPAGLLLRHLTRHIRHLIDHDLGALLNAMYRIDIHENKVKEIKTPKNGSHSGQMCVGTEKNESDHTLEVPFISNATK